MKTNKKFIAVCASICIYAIISACLALGGFAVYSQWTLFFTIWYDLTFVLWLFLLAVIFLLLHDLHRIQDFNEEYTRLKIEESQERISQLRAELKRLREEERNDLEGFPPLR